MGEVRHRSSGSLKQENKKHKSAGRTKGGLRRLAGAGRVGGGASTKKRRKVATKAERLNRAKQLQRDARESLMAKRRDAAGGAPKIVAVLALSERVDATRVARLLAGAEADASDEDQGVSWGIARVVATSPTVKYISAAHGDVMGSLDAVSIAEAVVLCMAYPPGQAEDEDGVEDEDERMSVVTGMSTASSLKYQSLADACSIPALKVMDAVKAMGSPPIAGLVVPPPSLQRVGAREGESLSKSALRRMRRRDISADRMARRYFGSEFGEKVPWLRLGGCESGDASSAAAAAERMVTGLVRNRKSEPNWRSTRSTVLCDEAEILDGLLRVSGWVRVAALSPDRLVHVPEHGAAAVVRIETTAGDAFLPDEIEQEPLEMRAEIDPLAGEQTWPDEADENFAPEGGDEKKRKNTMTSDYQAAWESDDNADDDEVSFDLNNAKNEDEIVEKRQRLAEEMEFPDEVDAPADQAARERFARYRPLHANLRDVDWDPYESLPRDYARAHALPNYDSSRKKAVLAATKESKGIPVGSYVTLYLRGDNFEASVERMMRQKGATPVVSLLRHENRLSVVHFLVKRVVERTDEEQDLLEEDEEPLASKDPVIARVGYRSWTARPVYSQQSLKGRTHKFERFFKEGEHCVATLFGPITFSPAPIFLFRNDKLVAVGSAMDADPNRIILKRIILTGIPVRTHKRKAVVKHMFYNPEDVRFYKPAQLSTKHGLTANITEPLGTHGHFKIALSRPMRQSDTIMLTLYKRVFPKFCNPFSSEGDDGVADGIDTSMLNSGHHGEDDDDYSKYFKVC